MLGIRFIEKVFSPRVIISLVTALSIDLIKAPVPIRAKTPIEILSNVRNALSLLTLTESNARYMLSRIFIHNLIFCYSNLNDSTGSSLEALNAGSKPAKIPTKTETTEAMIISLIGK